MTEPSASHDLIVVGAGVAGLALACGAARQGLSVGLVGAASAPLPRVSTAASAPFDARIYALAPGSQALLEDLAVWPQVDAARVQPVLKMDVRGDEGGALRFDAFQARVGRLASIVEESELLRVLDQASRFLPGLARYAASFERDDGPRRDDEDSADASSATLSVQLADGRVLRTSLLVGADGAQSAVRAAAGITAEVTSYAQTAVVANFATARAHQGTAWQWFSAEGVVALLPLPGQYVSLVWSAPDALAAELATLPPDALAARVAARAGDVLGALAPAGPVHSFPLRMIRVDRLIAPRVALVGDAAHVVHPLAGQGLNLGLQDVSELLTVLQAREAFRTPGDAAVLRRYARRRAESIALMRTTTDGLARLFGRPEPVARWLRNTGMSALDALAPVKRALIRQALG